MVAKPSNTNNLSAALLQIEVKEGRMIKASGGGVSLEFSKYGQDAGQARLRSCGEFTLQVARGGFGHGSCLCGRSRTCTALTQHFCSSSVSRWRAGKKKKKTVLMVKPGEVKKALILNLH